MRKGKEVDAFDRCHIKRFGVAGRDYGFRLSDICLEVWPKKGKAAFVRSGFL
jgi:hypothetical protein